MTRSFQNSTSPSSATEFEIALETTPTPVPDAPIAVRLIHDLLDQGVNFPDLARAAKTIEAAMDSAGDELGGRAIAEILSRLPGGRRGIELRLALIGAVDSCLADEARRLGMAPQILRRSVRRLRKRILCLPLSERSSL